jgi:hypothetical protein
VPEPGTSTPAGSVAAPTVIWNGGPVSAEGSPPAGSRQLRQQEHGMIGPARTGCRLAALEHQTGKVASTFADTDLRFRTMR